MTEVLGNPAIQSALAIIGVIVAVAIYWKQRKHKSLGYEVLSFMPLSSVDSNTLSRYQQIGLQFMFNNEIIPQAHFITVKFTNTGNVPITKGDFDEPLSLSFGDKAKILACSWERQNPHTIKLEIKIEAQKVTVDPTLLNSKDNFMIEMVVSGFEGKIVGGRIVGVKEIEDIRGGLPISREEELVDEALFISAIIFIFSLISEAYFVAIIAVVIAIVQVWRKIKLKVIRQMSQV